VTLCGAISIQLEVYIWINKQKIFLISSIEMDIGRGYAVFLHYLNFKFISLSPKKELNLLLIETSFPNPPIRYSVGGREVFFLFLLIC
jgi:hypothetical protein